MLKNVISYPTLYNHDVKKKNHLPEENYISTLLCSGCLTTNENNNLTVTLNYRTS